MHFQPQDPAVPDGASIAAAIGEQVRSRVRAAPTPASVPPAGEGPVSRIDQMGGGAACLARSLECLERLELAASEVSACAKRIGTPPPKPSTLRGGFGAFAIGLIGRALWWYTQRMQEFAAALDRRQEQGLETYACLVQAQEAFVQAQEVFVQAQEAFSGALNVVVGTVNDVRQQVQQLQASVVVAQTRFGLRCSELESAQIQAQSAQLDHVTSEELSEGLGGLTESLGSACASISALEGVTAAQAALLMESQVKFGMIETQVERGSAKLESLDRAHQTLAAGIGRLEEKVDTDGKQALNLLGAEEQARTAEVSRIEQRIEAVEQQTSARLGGEEQARAAEVSRVEQRVEAVEQQTSARLGGEEQARAAEVSRIEQKIEAVGQQTDARLVSISAPLEELAHSLQTETQTRETLAHETQVRIVRVEQKVDAGLDTALVRNATLDARLSGETQAREQLAQQLSDEFSRKDHTQERVADMGRLVHQTRAEVNLQEHRLSMLITEARKRLPDRLNKKQLENIVDQEDHKFDALYVAFENVFRGPREEIKARQSIYVPLLKEHRIGSKNMPVLDVGCGRGEWLELMRDNGLLAQGLDRNEIMIAQCRELGLDVVQGDALGHLRTLPDKSLGAVTAFHIVEHLPFEIVLAFIDETVRVLKPGGMVLFETPNPQNVLVGSMTFYYDPTHLRPLPSGMLRFFVEARGLCDVYIKDVNPYPEWVRLPDTDKGLARRLNEYFYGPQDYAVIGRKA